MRTCLPWFVFAACAVVAIPAHAQSLELGAHVVGAQWSEFDGTDLGIGGRLSWKPTTIFGLEGDVNWYPSAFPGDGIAFSGDRLEGMVALTAGPRLGRVRPFVRAGAGVLKSTAAPEPFACIAIFPPPLACLLAGGDTLPVFEIGGGLELSMTGATFLRLDAGDRVLKYPGPTLTGGVREDDGFRGHAFRFTFGGGIRF